MITVVGLSPSIDITYLVDDFQLGAIHRPTRTVRCAGGKSLNLARAARREAADVALVGLFGGPSGTWLASELSADGISVTAVDTGADSRTCVSIAANHQLTELYPYAPALDDQIWPQLLNALETLLPQRSGWLAITGSSPTGLPATALAELVELGHRHGVSVAVDAAGEPLRAILALRPKLVKINRAEASQALGIDASGDLQEMAIALRELTGGLVVLTDGSAGALGLDGRLVVRASLPPGVRGDYPVGSGDSFLGGLLGSLNAGDDLAAALKRATACGAANAMVPGAAVYERTAADHLSNQVVISAAHS